ncbi:CTR86, partial [Symbiodinium microadriaticum]
DLVRDLDGLPVVLSFCATDFDNPLCREYALMCVRNLCEGNAGNQQYISDLKPQQIVQDELMASHGLSVEIDPLS